MVEKLSGEKWKITVVERYEEVVETLRKGETPRSWIEDGQLCSNYENHDHKTVAFRTVKKERIASDYRLPGGH